MRILLLACLALSACAGSKPPPESAPHASFADQTRERWKRDDEKQAYEARQRGFVSGSTDRNSVQPQ